MGMEVELPSLPPEPYVVPYGPLLCCDNSCQKRERSDMMIAFLVLTFSFSTLLGDSSGLNRYGSHRRRCLNVWPTGSDTIGKC